MSYSCEVTPCTLVLWLYFSRVMNLASHQNTLITPSRQQSLLPNNLSDFLAGLIQKNAKFKLFAKHLYNNVECPFAEVGLAIINISITKMLES